MDKGAHRHRSFLICVSLAIATLAVFWQVQNNDFVNFDDGKYVTENRHVQDGLTRDGFVWAFTTTHANFWHPLTWLSHMLDCQLYGLNPRGHHFTNLLLHLANTMLLFLVLQRMRLCCRPVCSSPPSCGVCCMGLREEGCLEHPFLDTDNRGLCPLR
jgi:hypothetical protein